MHELPTPPGSTVRADQLSSAVRWTQSAHFMPPDHVSFFFFLDSFVAEGGDAAAPIKVLRSV